jgi:hypothetical protein
MTSAPLFPLVMAGLVPAIHVFFTSRTKARDVDARHKVGHDEMRHMQSRCRMQGDSPDHSARPSKLTFAAVLHRVGACNLR